MSALPLLALWLACATTREERQHQREDRVLTARLTEASELYWRALRWGDVGTVASFLEDPDYRVEWLTTGTDSATSLRDATVLRVELGERAEDDAGREGIVVVQVQSYRTDQQVLEKAVLTQDWYLTGRTWWVKPGQEHGVGR